MEWVSEAMEACVNHMRVYMCIYANNVIFYFGFFGFRINSKEIHLFLFFFSYSKNKRSRLGFLFSHSAFLSGNILSCFLYILCKISVI